MREEGERRREEPRTRRGRLRRGRASKRRRERRRRKEMWKRWWKTHQEWRKEKKGCGKLWSLGKEWHGDIFIGRNRRNSETREQAPLDRALRQKNHSRSAFGSPMSRMSKMGVQHSSRVWH